MAISIENLYMGAKAEQPYNGLESFAKTLAKFLFIYETEIKKFNRADDLPKHLSKSAGLVFSKRFQYKIRYQKKNVLNDGDNLAARYSLEFTQSKTQILDFCRHIRNSLCHCLLRKDGSKIYIIDKDGRGRYTSRGYVPFQDMRQFVIQIINDFENKDEK